MSDVDDDAQIVLSRMLLSAISSLRSAGGRTEVCCRVNGCRSSTSGKAVQICVEEILLYAPSSGSRKLDTPITLAYGGFALVIYRRGADYVAWRHDGSKKAMRTDHTTADRFFRSIDNALVQRR